MNPAETPKANRPDLASQAPAASGDELPPVDAAELEEGARRVLGKRKPEAGWKRTRPSGGTGERPNGDT